MGLPSTSTPCTVAPACLPAKAKAIHPTAFDPKHLFAGAPDREAHFPVLGVQM